MHGLSEFTREAQVRRTGFAPHQIGIGGIGHTPADGLLQAVLDAEETFLRPLACQEGLVIGIVIRSD